MSEAGDDGPGRREVAYRIFATEFDDADLQYAESDEERAPNYVVTPTGARVNRLFVAGVLTEVQAVSEEVLRGRVVDPTGGFVCYAGQYQADERAALDRIEPPAFVAVTGKARTFQPEDGDRVFTSVRPESISTVDAETRDRWTVTAAERTLERVQAMATAIALDASGDRLRTALLDRGVDESLASGITVALQHYGTTPTYLAAVRDLAIDAARHVAGELDEVPELSTQPGEEGDVAVTDLLDESIEPLAAESGSESSDRIGRGVDDTETAESEKSSPATHESGDEPPEQSAAGTAANEATDRVEPETTRGGSADPASEFDLDAEERETVEAEYGTEFQSAAEVDEPGEADIETPDPEAATAEPGEASGDPTDSGNVDSHDESSEAETPAENGDIDLVDAVVDAMADLDDGDGADRTAVIESVAERAGVDTAEVEDAVQDALMEGRCYEPDDGTLKPI
ncbi:MAG: hypothetical protein ABEH64_08055 [Salinirussus sp.]